MIETRDLTKKYGDFFAIRSIDLQLQKGDLFGFIGPNGAGKTTTMRIIATLLDPSWGEAYVDGYSIYTHPKEIRRIVGYMPDFFGVYEDMRSWEYLDFFARCYGIPADERAGLVEELLDLVDLAGKRDADVNDLSRGMKQRLCLAHALVHDPEILLLDEPASGLDPRARLEMRELLRELRAMGKTIVISSHILTEMKEICDAVGIMEQGELLAGGNVDEIEQGLAPGRVVEVRVLSDLAAAAAVAQDLPDVQVQAMDAPAPEGPVDGRLYLSVEGPDERLAQILAQLVGAGVAVASFRPRERDLEKIFMEITKGAVS